MGMTAAIGASTLTVYQHPDGSATLRWFSFPFLLQNICFLREPFLCLYFCKFVDILNKCVPSQHFLCLNSTWFYEAQLLLIVI
uniref:Uncharacterized protein n=1 Tax=Arundo donax TaxID=35708 RepID=A0A0A9E7G0_ARUDO